MSLPATAPTGFAGADGNQDLRRVAGFTWVLSVAAFVELTAQAYRTGVLAISVRWQAVLGLFAIVLVVAAIAILFLGRWAGLDSLATLTRRAGSVVGRRGIRLGLMAAAALLCPLAVFGASGRYLEGTFPKLLLFWLAILVLSLGMKSWFPRTPWRALLLATALVYGVWMRALAFVPDISSYPFSLGWSEASRYYYASLFRSAAIYGVRLSPPVLHPTRYLMQSVPFLVAGLPLWFHRLWQVGLWWLLPIGTAGLLVARHRLQGRWVRFLVGCWIVLYLLQAPVYYHLLVSVVIVLLGLDPRRPWRTTLFVVAASAWTGISRINWFPVPGLLAGCLYLLETSSDRKGWVALRWPAAWLVGGTLVAFISDAAYVRLSGIPPDQFASSLASPLLFYRLLPNPTFSLGIFPAIAIASGPLLVSLWWARPAWLSRLDGLRGLFLAGSLSVLALGGAVVSLKIGGGSNLHNLDAYLVLLLLVGSDLLLQSAPRGQPRSFADLPPFRSSALLVAIPVAFGVLAGGQWLVPDSLAARNALRQIAEAAQAASARGERVLFISQRQLLTFGLIRGVPLEPDYETVYLMEMAMAGNRPYLDRFHQLLEQRAFGLIVVDHLTTAFQGQSHNFGEENDAWVREVSRPILCWYEPALRLESPRVDLLTPRATGATCEGSSP